MTSAFDAALTEAVDLLRTLPRRRDAVPEARRAVAEWRATRPATRAQLVADVRPGSPIVDYDLVLAHPDGGSVALTAPADDGVPWTLDHSTHWASGRVVTVDGFALLIQNALLTLRTRTERDSTMQEELIDYCILSDMAGREPPPTQEELQQASDAYRVRNGLRSRADMMRWLTDVGLNETAYTHHIFGLALKQRVRARIEQETARDYLERNPSEFDHVWALWAEGPEDRLTELAGAPDPVAALIQALSSRDRITVTTADGPALDLPEPMRTAPAGAVTGPVPHGKGHLLGVVRERRPADLADPRTLAAAGRAGFAEYMAERRAKAAVTWHWL
ncbi:TIGR04500 family putative peptide maturation system protein [Microbispora sp. H10670]|uniref:TIGR04500 family putative peptide maturation system protein n=1 Tax=Microbispora sp. H10670 TaxID=2729108 RepID=UPI0016033687|nr:TIGR04500 family putative peptide maturation system protein [Microbispora sp. H10670]